MSKSELQSDLFRVHEQAKREDERNRRFNKIYCEWLDKIKGGTTTWELG